jgi:hypothetical protein
VGSFLFGLLGGFVAWIATAFFVQPLSGFFGLRAEAAEALARYEDRFNPNPDVTPPSADWLAERKRAYETCGAKLVAFAISNWLVARLLYRLPLTPYYARSAGSSLQSLADAGPGTQASHQLRGQVVSALKLNYWPSMRRRRS